MAEDTSSSFEKILQSIPDIFEPFNTLFNSSGSVDYVQVKSWLFRLGYDLSLPDTTWDNFTSEFHGILTNLQSLPNALEAVMQSNGVLPFPNVVPLLEIVRSLISNVNNLCNDLQSLASFAGNQSIGPQIEAMVRDLPVKILDDLMVTYLEKYHKPAFSLFTLLGIIERSEMTVLSIPPSPSDQAPAIQYPVLHWEDIPTWMTNPLSMMETTYHWQAGEGNDQFLAEKFLTNLNNVIGAYSLPGGAYTADINRKLKMGETVESLMSANWTEIRFPLNTGGVWPDTYWEIGFSLSIAAGIDADRPKGLAIMPYLFCEGQKEYKYSTSIFDISLDGGAEMDLSKGAGLIIRPPSQVEYFNNLQVEDPSSPPVNIEITLRVQQNNGTPFVILGSENSTGVSLNGVNGKIIFSRTGSKNDFGFEISVDDLKLVIASGAGDGFIQRLLPQNPIEVSGKIALGMSTDKGFYINGGAGTTFVFQINEQIGPIFISTMNMELDISDHGISLLLGISGNAQLGPVIASVDNIGIKVDLIFGQPGLLGKADLDLAFKPPSGIAITIDADSVKGGGFFETRENGYDGVLELAVMNRVTITAIGILTTRLPDGTKIFSLKLFGSATFPPIQLGFGFTLTGVGLAVAIDCAMDTDALVAAVNSGSLRDLLFPEDPSANAAQIISSLNAFFPPRRGVYIFGAMAQIGWGGATPLAQADVGVFLEISDTLRIALAGVIQAVLPSSYTPILVLQVEMLGLLDLHQKTLSFRAKLKGSRLLDWNLDGDIALFTCWGDNPRFAFSAGGFYPGYPIPAGFPHLDRVSLSLGSDNPSITLTTYFALTENSVHFGAGLAFHWSDHFSWPIGHIEIEGGLSFDAFLQFSPFRFKCQIEAWLDLKRNGDVLFGIYLHLTLTGPNNYFVDGTAEFDIIGIGIEVDFQASFGEKTAELDGGAISPMAALQKEIAEPKNWSIVAPSWGNAKVIFFPGETQSDSVDPFGSIQFRQRSVPLKFGITKFGNAAIPPEENWFDIAVPVAGLTPASDDTVVDGFAPGEFNELTDDEKISRPPFEKFKSGVGLMGDSIAYPHDLVQDRDLVYETTEMTTGWNHGNRTTGVTVNTGLLGPAISAAGKKFYRGKGVSTPAERKNRISISEQKFAVVTQTSSDGKLTMASGAKTSTAADAQANQKKAGSGCAVVDSRKVG